MVRGLLHCKHPHFPILSPAAFPLRPRPPLTEPTTQGVVIWACLDPANPFVSPSGVPFAIGLSYAAMIFGFADVTISTNLARDLGCRIVAAIFFGSEAFTYHHYPWISVLVNVPATIFATTYYELLMRDSLQRIARGGARHEGGEEGLGLHLVRSGVWKGGRDAPPLMQKGVTNQVENSTGSGLS